MARKIRLIDEEPNAEAMDAADNGVQLMELAKSIDWKLWELLQTMQRLEKKLSVINEEE
jgi:Fe-S cluster biosynthesis and repair protein YggX